MKKLLLSLMLLSAAACSPAGVEPIGNVQEPLAGPVAAYGFDEGLGTTTVDRSGNNLTGTLGNKSGGTPPIWVAGKYGQGLRFNGSNSWVTVASASPLNLTTGMTLEAWVMPTASMTGTWRELLYKENGSSFRYALYANTNGNNSLVSYNDNRFTFGPTLAVNAWTHVAGTFNGSSLKIYINGVQQGTINTTTAIGTSTGALRMGGSASEGEFFNGVIDEVRVYNRALSVAEIQSDMTTPINSGDAGQDAAADASQDAQSETIDAPAETNDASGETNDAPAETIDAANETQDGAGDVVAEEAATEASDSDAAGDAGNADEDATADAGTEDSADAAPGDDATDAEQDAGADAGESDSGTTDGGPASVYPLRKLAGARYLIDQAGNPFLMQGESPWQLISNLTIEDASLYLDDRKAKGFNSILVELVDSHFQVNPPANRYGEQPFLVPNDISTPNEAYFARADIFIQAAAARGIQVLLFPLYLGNNGGNEGWWSALSAGGASKATIYGTYVGNRYRNVDNILWVVGGDYTPPDGANGKGLVNTLANAIKTADSRHLMTEHGSRFREAALEDYAGQPWLDLDAVYTDEPGVGGATADQYGRSDWLPVFLIEAQYENEGPTAKGLRQQSYEAILNGGMGQVWGNSPIWCFSTQGGCFFSGGPPDWHNALNTVGAQDQTRVWNLLSVRHWEKLVPDASHTFVTANFAGKSIERASDGTWAAAYLPSGGVTVNLGSFAQPISGVWYDPTNGSFATLPGSPFANSGSLVVPSHGNNAAGASDWVLVFE